MLFSLCQIVTFIFGYCPTSIKDSIESHTLSEGTLMPDASVDYKVSFWMDEAATTLDDVMKKVFKSKIVVISEPTTDTN